MDNLENISPKVIAFEGMDGSGKTTLLTAVQDLLDAEGIPNTRVSMMAMCQSREVLLHDHTLTPIQRIMLIGVCAIEAKKQIAAAMAEGKWVLLDRTEMSRAVYQEIVEGLSIENRQITAMIGEFPKIDYFVYLDIPIDTAMQRMLTRGNTDTFEIRGREFFSRIHQAYTTNVEAYGHLQDHNLQCGRHVTQVFIIDGEENPLLNAAMVFGEIHDHLSGAN